jgi:hypothetical protein
MKKRGANFRNIIAIRLISGRVLCRTAALKQTTNDTFCTGLPKIIVV